MNSTKVYKMLYAGLLSEKVRVKGEEVIISVAIISFFVHLMLVLLNDFDILQLDEYSRLLTNPIAAIYTPFSFVLIYEVYLLVYYLPKSTTFYIGKQYEIITLILIRNVFKDLSQLEFTPDWFNVASDLRFTYDLAATLVLFFMIFIFYKLNERRCIESGKPLELSPEVKRFIRLKEIIAMILIPVFLLLAFFSLGSWFYQSFFSISQLVYSVKDVNKVFFDEFFTVLILIDVLLLLISFLLTDEFHRVIRNSGFIISTILIKLSFSIEGLLSVILILVAVLFGVIILAISNQYERLGRKHPQ